MSPGETLSTGVPQGIGSTVFYRFSICLYVALSSMKLVPLPMSLFRRICSSSHTLLFCERSFCAGMTGIGGHLHSSPDSPTANKIPGQSCTSAKVTDIQRIDRSNV